MFDSGQGCASSILMKMNNDITDLEIIIVTKARRRRPPHIEGKKMSGEVADDRHGNNLSE
jgi:hypothetical protein